MCSFFLKDRYKRVATFFPADAMKLGCVVEKPNYINNQWKCVGALNAPQSIFRSPDCYTLPAAQHRPVLNRGVNNNQITVVETGINGCLEAGWMRGELSTIKNNGVAFTPPNYEAFLHATVPWHPDSIAYVQADFYSNFGDASGAEFLTFSKNFRIPLSFVWSVPKVPGDVNDKVGTFDATPFNGNKLQSIAPTKDMNHKLSCTKASGGVFTHEAKWKPKANNAANKLLKCFENLSCLKSNAFKAVWLKAGKIRAYWDAKIKPHRTHFDTIMKKKDSAWKNEDYDNNVTPVFELEGYKRRHLKEVFEEFFAL